MSKNDKRLWIRLPFNETTLKMEKDMQEWKTQSGFIMHVLTVYYNLTKRKDD